MSYSQVYPEMSELEKKVFWREREYRQAMEEAAEAERESIQRELLDWKAEYSKMTDAERAEFWRHEEQLSEFIKKATAVVVPALKTYFESWAQTSVADFREASETSNLAAIEKAKALEASTDKNALQFCVGTLERQFGALLEVAEPLRSYAKIDRYLRTLLGDAYLSPLPMTMRGQLRARGVDKDPSDLSLVELFEILSQPEKECWIDTVMPTLDMIFGPRYGWPEGTAKTMTIPELCLALEHAIEHDDPAKPSVWRMA
jgi:hypothetical protein